MTLPDERYRAVMTTRKFLQQLAGGEFSRVPKAVRAQALGCLRHFPSEWEMDRLSERCPDVVSKQLDDLHRFVLKGSEEQNLKNNPLDSSKE